MQESKYPRLLTIEIADPEGNGTQLVGELAAPLHGVGYGDTVEEVLNNVADIVEVYKARASYSARVTDIDNQIRQLQIEREALISADQEHLPIYSLLDEAEREYYVRNTKGINPGYINWYQKKYGKKITAIYLIANPFANRYGGLIWQWAVVDAKDIGNG